MRTLCSYGAPFAAPGRRRQAWPAAIVRGAGHPPALQNPIWLNAKREALAAKQRYSRPAGFGKQGDRDKARTVPAKGGEPGAAKVAPQGPGNRIRQSRTGKI